MTLTDLAPDDSGEHDTLDDELVARLGPPPVFRLGTERDPAARAAGWLVVTMLSLVVWFLVGLVVLLAVD